MPYIMDLMDDDEEILIVLAETLNGQFLDHVGGPLFAPHLFKPLERLCEAEESTIRDKVRQNKRINFWISKSILKIEDSKKIMCQ